MNETRLSKIATQGFKVHGVDSYINTFKVQTSLDGINFATSRKNGKDWVSREPLINSDSTITRPQRERVH